MKRFAPEISLVEILLLPGGFGLSHRIGKGKSGVALLENFTQIRFPPLKVSSNYAEKIPFFLFIPRLGDRWSDFDRHSEQSMAEDSHRALEKIWELLAWVGLAEAFPLSKNDNNDAEDVSEGVVSLTKENGHKQIANVEISPTLVFPPSNPPIHAKSESGITCWTLILKQLFRGFEREHIPHYEWLASLATSITFAIIYTVFWIMFMPFRISPTFSAFWPPTGLVGEQRRSDGTGTKMRVTIVDHASSPLHFLQLVC